MASKQDEILKLFPGEKFTVGIKNGPNDWDLWLAFRTIIDGVEFRLDKTIWIPELPDSTSKNLRVAITGLKKPSNFSNFDEIMVTGFSRTSHTSVQINFSGPYNVRTRKGSLTLNLYVR